MAATRPPSRRMARKIVSHFANRRFVLSSACVSIIGAKIFHLYVHFSALDIHDIQCWGLTFFYQDVVLLLLLRLLLDPQIFARPRFLQVLATALASTFVLAVLTLAGNRIAFLTVTGAEPHWGDLEVPDDSRTWTNLVAGVASFIFGLAGILVVSWALQDVCYFFLTVALDVILKTPVRLIIGTLTFAWDIILNSPVPLIVGSTTRKIRRSSIYRGMVVTIDASTRKLTRSNIYRKTVERFTEFGLRGLGYERVPKNDAEVAAAEYEYKYKTDGSEDLTDAEPAEMDRLLPTRPKLRVASYLLIGTLMLALFILSHRRPQEASLVFMSWTLPILPFIPRSHRSPVLAHLRPVYGTGIGWNWDNVTAVGRPEKLPWLPKKFAIHGFEDWHGKRPKDHYRGSRDPLRVSNTEDDLLPGIRDALVGLRIQNVLLIVLESTRKDVFPIKKNGAVWDKLQNSFQGQEMPEDAKKTLSTLTPTANYITGDYDDGFMHTKNRRRGGLNMRNAYTSSTSSLKSLTGTLCGISPLIGDANAEKSHHIYNPCLPQVLEAFNELAKTKKPAWNDTTSHKWRSDFMQSVTEEWKAQDTLVHQWGFGRRDPVSKEHLESNRTRGGLINQTDLDYYGVREPVVEEYIRDAFVSAKKKKERLFLTHLTNTGRYPFDMPDGEEYTVLNGDPAQDDLSRYTNSMGSVDRWLGRVLKVLDDQGVANETLVVVTGDHGLSIVEDGSVSTDHNTNAANFHVPLVFSHPDLPVLDIDEPVNSLQILPTILDLLLTTDSIMGPQRLAAHDLLRTYEGQSLIRPIRDSSEHTGQSNWQFTLVSPGDTMVAVRDSRAPNWRIVIPIVDGTGWRFTDLWADPRETDPTTSFSFVGFLSAVEVRHGLEAAQWAEEAAFITRWWVQDNSRRWRYNTW